MRTFTIRLRSAILCLSTIVTMFCLLCYRASGEPQFMVRAQEVSHIELRYAELDTILDNDPVMQDDNGYIITNTDDIELICEIVSTMYIREFPMKYADPSWEERTIRSTRLMRFIFYLKNGETKILEFGSHTVLFDDHWCFASAGEAYGYKPIYLLTLDIVHRASQLE